MQKSLIRTSRRLACATLSAAMLLASSGCVSSLIRRADVKVGTYENDTQGRSQEVFPQKIGMTVMID